MGFDPFHSVETPLSIFENILTQIEYNYKNCTPYLDKYLINPIIANYIFGKGKRVIKQFYTALTPYQMLEEKKERQKWIKRKRNKQNIIQACTKVITNLKRGLFQEYVKTIISYLTCPHDLNQHKNNIKFISRLIISDFLLNGFTQKDVVKLFDIVLEEDVNTKKLHQQFEKITKRRFTPFRSSYVLCKVYGMTMQPNEIKEINGITFLSSNSPKLEKLKTEMRKGFFFKHVETFCIAFIKRKYRSKWYAHQEAAEIIKRFVRNLNKSTSYNCLVSETDFIITNNFIESQSHSIPGENPTIKDYDAYTFRKAMRYSSYSNKGIRTKALEKFQEFENIFEIANIDTALPEYWRYFESLFADIYKGNIPEKVRTHIAHIILIQYQEEIKTDLTSSIYNYFINDFISLGFSIQDYNRMARFDKFDVSEVKSICSDPFILDVIATIENETSKTKLQDVCDYYINNLLELYEYRNHHIHTGKDCKNLKIKLSYSIAQITRRFRETMMDEIQKGGNKRKTLSSIIDSINRKGRGLCLP